MSRSDQTQRDTWHLRCSQTSPVDLLVSTDSTWHLQISQRSSLALALGCHHRLVDVKVSIGDNLVDRR